MFELRRNTLHVWNIHKAQRFFLFIRMTATFGINARIKEALGIIVGLRMASRLLISLNRSCHSWHMVEALLRRF
jgi:hypothetical protein